MTRPLYELLASRIDARSNCIRDEREKPHLKEWIDGHRNAADALAREHLPSGSGFDNGTRIDWTRSTGEKLVLVTAFHHMNDTGMYDGWTDHTVTVYASLLHGLTIRVSGRDRNGIKDMMAEAFDASLRSMIG